MKNQIIKSIHIKEDTHARLSICKKYPEESYDKVIRDILDKSKLYELKWKDVSEETYTNLLRNKKTPDESIDSVLKRLLFGDGYE
jgi:hypothetical protein